MIMILIVSGVIMPAFIWLLLYFNLTEQYTTTKDGDTVLVETKVEAQKDIFDKTIKSPFFWIYITYSTAIIFAGTCSINAFGLGDWYFSL